MTPSQEQGAAPWDKAHVGLWGVFDTPKFEELYRREQMNLEAGRARVYLICALVGFLIFSISDYRLFGTTAQFWALLSARSFASLFSVIALARLRKAQAPRDFDRLMTIWLAVCVPVFVYINSTRPGHYTGHAIVTVTCVLVGYLVAPVPLRLQAIFAAALTVGSVLVLFIDPAPDRLTTLAVAASLVAANVLGGVTARESHFSKRRQFAAMQRENELRLSLERALARTLRGIIPICAHCKRIRNDAGFWQKVEVYVGERTYAEFSHGLCPECLQTYHPEFRPPERF